MCKRRTFAPLLILAILILAGTATGADDGGMIPEVVRNEKRQLYVEQDTFFASINSFTKVEGAPWFKFQINAHDELEVRASYGFNDRVRSNVGMDIKFIALVEYQDTNGDSVYDEMSERMVSFYPLSTSAYRTDFINRQREWEETAIDEGTTIIQNGSWDWDYANAFQKGFLLGWDLGFSAGAEDSKNGAPRLPDIEQRLPSDVLEDIKTRLSRDLYRSGYPEDVTEWLVEGALRAVHLGFRAGYDRSYTVHDKDPALTNIDAESATIGPTSDDAGTATDVDSGSVTTEDTSGEAEADSRTEGPNVASSEEDPLSSAMTSGEDTDMTADGTSDTGSAPTEQAFSETRAGEGAVPSLSATDAIARPAENLVPRYRPLKAYKTYSGDAMNYVIETWDNNNVFGLRCVVSSRLMNITGGYQSPSSMKVDILIGEYPYSGRDTKLALVMEMGSEITYSGSVDMERLDRSYDQSFGLASDEEEVRFRTGNFSGFFSWARTAMVDGKEARVMGKVMNSIYGNYWIENGGRAENHKGVLFCYPRGRSIVHDPKIGFIEIEDLNVYTEVPIVASVEEHLRGDPMVYTIAAVGVIAFVAATWRRRGPSN